MSSTANSNDVGALSSMTPQVGSKNRQNARCYLVGMMLWCIGVIVFIVSCFVIHAHPGPYSFDLATTEAVQGWHPFASWVNPVLEFPSALHNPVPAYIALGVWLVMLLLGTLILRLRGLRMAALLWLLSAVFFALADMISAGINALLDDVIGRPRPNPHTEPIHVYTPFVAFPTYPSGHAEHDIVYYGFLLYLSFLRPVRRWKYRWILLPLQVYAVFDMLVIGYSRILEGDHWFTDVLGGYLEGVLCLCFFIFLYYYTARALVRWRERRIAQLTASIKS